MKSNELQFETVPSLAETKSFELDPGSQEL